MRTFLLLFSILVTGTMPAQVASVNLLAQTGVIYETFTTSIGGSVSAGKFEAKMLIGAQVQPIRAPITDYGSFPDFIPLRLGLSYTFSQKKYLNAEVLVESMTNLNSPYQKPDELDKELFYSVSLGLSPTKKWMNERMNVIVYLGLLDVNSLRRSSGFGFTSIKGRLEFAASYAILSK